MTVVDTHAHVYSEDSGRYPFCQDPYLPPAGKGTLAHLRDEMRASGVERVVMVHTFTAYRWDNSLLANSVRESREWATGVCALNPNDPASPAVLETYRRECGVRGLRVFPVPDGRGGRDLELPGHLRLWERCEELGIVVCALIHPPQIPALRRLLRRFPAVPVVLDHCANLEAGDGPDGERLREVLALAEFPNLHAKISFLVTGSREPYPCPDMHAIGRRIVEAFGPRRCMWGSDFPCELWIPKAAYGEHLRLVTEGLGLDGAAAAAVAGETAGRLWFPAG